MATEFDFFLERLKDRVVLSDLVASKVKLKKTGGHYSGLCPFHKEKTPSFSVQNNKGTYHCFGCGAHGSVIDWVMNTQGMGFIDAVESLARSVNLEIPQGTEKEREFRVKKSSFLDILEKVCQFFMQALQKSEGQEALGYLHKRGVSVEMMNTFRLGYAPPGNILHRYLMSQGIALDVQLELGVIGKDAEKGHVYDYFRGRLMFPIFNRQGQVVAFGGRSLNDDMMPKYLNSPETRLFHKGEMLYGGHLAAKAIKNGAKLLAVEGYMDVIALHQAGFCGAVAPLGTALGELQLEEMWRLSATPILCLDGDLAGQKAAFRVLERALPLIDPEKLLYFVSLKDGEDPDSFLKKHGREQFLNELTHACSVFEYMWEELKKAHVSTTPESLALFSKSFKDMLKTIASSDLRTVYFEEFYKKYEQTFKSPSYQAIGKKEAPQVGKKLDARNKLLEVLMRSVVERPALLPLIEADFLTMTVFPETENLHTAIVDYYFSQQPLEKDQLKPYLIDRGLALKQYTMSESVGFKGLLQSNSIDLQTVAIEWILLYHRWSDFNEIRNFKLGNIKRDDDSYVRAIKARIEGLQTELQEKTIHMDNGKEVTSDA